MIADLSVKPLTKPEKLLTKGKKFETKRKKCLTKAEEFEVKPEKFESKGNSHFGSAVRRAEKLRFSVELAKDLALRRRRQMALRAAASRKTSLRK